MSETTTALLLSADDGLTDQVASALGRVDGLDSLRRAGTLGVARTVLGHTRVGLILADPRVEDGSPAEVAAWVQDREEPGLLLLPADAVEVCAGALVHDVPHEVVVAGAPAELLAAAVRRALVGVVIGDDWRDRIAVVRHEMATPLTAVEGFLDVLRTHGDRLPEHRRHQSLDAAHRNVGRLRRLVADLNAAAKAGGPVVRTAPEVVPLRAALRRTLQDLGADGAQVEVEVEPGLQVRVDADALQAIVSNLVTNAFKYGAPPVELRARAVDDHVEIAVTDHGQGVPESFRAHLFERYSRADQSRDASPGSGLGLWLCGKLAAAMGGELRYESEGNGATFVLSVVGRRSEQLDDSDDGVPVLAGGSHTPRPVIAAFEVVREGLEAQTTVGLAVGSRSAEARAVSTTAQASGLRAVARATVDAVSAVLHEDASFDVESVRVEGEGDDEYVLTTITAVTSRGFERFAGVSFTYGDRPRAALRATLDALNRRIEPLLA